MMISNAFLLVFAVAFMGCVLATPVVTRIAVWAGAIDRPDQFRRIHKGATPRLGGLGVAFGVFVGVALVLIGGYLDSWDELPSWIVRQVPVLFAAIIVLGLGFIDDTRGVGPRAKLLAQGAAVVVLFLGGVRIHSFQFLGISLDFTHPALSLAALGIPRSLPLPSFFITMFWFLACMNIWNLIDGMDGLASGVGLLVSSTLTLVAIHQENIGVAITAAALAGSLAGFLLYNWHPACIFLGDSGSLLIGLLIGVIGVQGSFKGPSATSILFPILAMGLPISDTALAIFRRWVRNLPFTAADRRHVHHLLIGLGLNPRQASIFLYCLTGFLCGVVLLGVAFRNEQVALILGASGCLAFLLILTSRLNELTSLRLDLRARLYRGKQERFAAKIAWEAIQRIEVCTDTKQVCAILEKTTHTLGCDSLKIECSRGGATIVSTHDVGPGDPVLSGSTAIFRLSSGRDLRLAASFHLSDDSALATDIVFRFLQRLSEATAERLEELLATRTGGDEAEGSSLSAANQAKRSEFEAAGVDAQEVVALTSRLDFPASRSLFGWLRIMLGSQARPAGQPSLSEE